MRILSLKELMQVAQGHPAVCVCGGGFPVGVGAELHLDSLALEPRLLAPWTPVSTFADNHLAMPLPLYHSYSPPAVALMFCNGPR